MDQLKEISNISGLGVAALAILFSYWVLIKYKKNGNGNGNGEVIKGIQKISTNELVHIQAGIDKILDKQNELVNYQEKQLYILEEIKNKICK